MIKRVLLALVLFLVGSLALFLWARSVFTHDNVRTTIAAQMAEALGQPVTIGTIGTAIYPRITIDLGEVTIGDPSRIRITSLHLGTDFRALLSRRIEHANVRVDGARVALPFPTLGPRTPGTSGTSGTPGTLGTAPVTLVSIDEILLRNIELVSGGHTLVGDIDAVPTSTGVTLRRIALEADKARVEGHGEITNLAGPVGALNLKAGEIDVDRLLAFLGEFAAGVASGGAKASPPQQSPPDGVAAKLTIALESARAKTGSLILDKLAGKAIVTDQGVTLEPIGFEIFGGRYDGTLAVTMAEHSPSFRGKAAVSGIDMGALSTFAGSGDLITGRLSGTVDLEGTGADLGAAVKSLRGGARVDIANGVVRNLNLVRKVVLATSGRADSTAQAAAQNAGGERFTRLGASLAIAGGMARTTDLRFESPDVSLRASGTLALNGSSVAVAGIVQLSPALSKQAGRDLYRYTSEDGRVTLPATISGPASNLVVRVDVTDLTKRALRNKATEEINRAIERNLGSLFKKPPR